MIILAQPCWHACPWRHIGTKATPDADTQPCTLTKRSLGVLDNCYSQTNKMHYLEHT